MTTTTGGNVSSVSHWRETVRDFVEYTPSGDTIPDETWRSRHRNVVLLVLAHVPALLLLGLYEGKETLVTGAVVPSIPLTSVLLELGVVTGFALLAVVPRFPRRLRTILAVTGLLFSSGVLVHFSGGYIEAHFHFFVAMAVVAVYEDWLPFAFGIVYVVVTHGVFGMVDPTRVYNHTAAINRPWVWGVVHGVFVTGLAVALMSNWYSTEKSRERATQGIEQARRKAAEVEDLEAKQAEIEEKRAEAQQMRAEAEAQKAEVEELYDRLEATASDYSTAMAMAAAGDLTVRLDDDTESEAMAEVAEAFNEMMDETESAVREIQAFADDVAVASEESNDAIGEARSASEDVSESIQTIASGTDDQREMLETVSNEMTTLSATVEEVAASAETVAETADQTAKLSESGAETAQEAIESAQEVQTAIASTVDSVEALDDRMDEIGEIVELIGEIAEQTNMLALNANIEAARAGDGGAGGDGFAVVADEVKQLAEETQASATEIEQLIEETQTQTTETVDEAQLAERSMDENVAAVEDVRDAFRQVVEIADETDSGIREISETTDDQAASTEEAVSMVEEVAEISQSTAAETENASAAAQEQAASMTEMSDTADSLSERAERLQALLATFEVDETGAGSPPATTRTRN